MKKYVCPICGYVHEGDLPADFNGLIAGIGIEILDGSQSDVRSRISRVVQLVKGRLRRHDARKLPCIDNTC